MKRLALVIGLLVLLGTGCASTGGGAKKPAAAEDPRILGSWSGMGTNGIQQSFDFRPDGWVRWTLELDGGSQVLDLRYTVDATEKPMRLDLHGFESGPLREQSLYGILEFKGRDQMRFESKPGLSTEPGAAEAARPRAFTEDAVEYARVTDAGARRQIEALVARLLAADNAGDADRVAECYTDDVVFLPPGETPLVGKGTINERYRKLFERTRLEIGGDLEEVTIDGNLAFGRGWTAGRAVPRADGPTSTIRDQFLMVFQRGTDGQWRIARLVWNNAPTPEKPRPRRRTIPRTNGTADPFRRGG